MAKTTFELFQLRCFVAVAKELNFRRAAVRMNMTQPPLSRQIKLLEEAIDLKLFDRNNRSVRLTPAGESFRASAIDLLARAERAVLTARQAERGEIGTVTMGFVPSAALDFVPRIVATLKSEMSDIRFDPIEMMSYEIVEALLSGQIDLGLTRTTGQHSEILSTQAVREPFILAMPRNHRLAGEVKVDMHCLDGEDIVGYSFDRGGYLKDIHNAMFATAGIHPRVVQEVSQTHTVLALVNVGLGIALVPRSSAAMQMENLVFRPIEQPDQFSSMLYLNSAKSRQTTLLTRISETILKTLRAGCNQSQH